MFERDVNQVHTLSKVGQPDDYIIEWVAEFLKAKKIEGISPYTLRFYQQQLGHFLQYCEAQVIERLAQITPGVIRAYLLWMEETRHSPGGLHAAYRPLKTFLRWYDVEAEPENWRNPINKVKAPKLKEEPLEPVELETVTAMVRTCDGSFLGKRNKAILLALLDTGLRARELLSLNLEDINPVSGEILLRVGKGRKPRIVFVGRESRKVLRAYLRARQDNHPALWVTDDCRDRLAYGGLRKVLKRHAEKAGVEIPTAHDFRRAFALNMLRNRVDLVTLSRLMGHTSIKVLQRYLKQLPEDLHEAHRIGSPVDNARFFAAKE